MRALTIQQPWAFAITEGFKTIENRRWRTHYRGPLLIHTGQTFDHGATLARYDRAAAERLDQLGGRSNFWDPAGRIPSKMFAAPPTSLAMGAIIGVARIADCHRCDLRCSPWAEPGVWHWTLADIRPLREPVPCKGRLQLWTPDADALDAVTAHLEVTT